MLITRNFASSLSYALLTEALKNYPTQKDFCRASGVTYVGLSRVLKDRKVATSRIIFVCMAELGPERTFEIFREESEKAAQNGEFTAEAYLKDLATNQKVMKKRLKNKNTFLLERAMSEFCRLQ